MIARPDSGLLAEALDEAARDAADGLYIVPHVDDAEALALLGAEAVVAGRAEQVLEWSLAAADAGRPVVLVGDTGAAVRDSIRRAAPHARLLRLAEPASPSLALSINRTVRTPTPAELRAAAATWKVLAAEAREDSAPTANGPHDDEGDYSPPPVDLLPSAVRLMVKRGADSQGTDVAYWLVPVLAILAGSVGSTRCVRLSEDWAEPCVLWSAIVAPSGAGKSPPLRELLAPVVARNRELHARSVALRQAYDAERDSRRGDRDARGQVPEPPPTLRATVADVTMEALASRLADNPRGLLVACDELASWVGGFDRYRAGGDSAQWLSIHGGDAIQVDRRGAGSLLVPHAAVSVVGTIQPGTARRVIASEQHRASGLAARLLLAMPPLVAPRWTDRTIGDEARGGYRRVAASLLDLAHGEDGEPIELALSDEAHEQFVRFVNDSGSDWLAAIHAGEADVAAALAKLRGGAARIALVLALARHAEDGTAALARTVEADDMRAGIALARWFEGEARRLYGRWADDEAQSVAGRERGSLSALADRLASILAAGQHALDELHRATGRCINGNRLRAALALLAGGGRATCERIPGQRGGRSREVWSLVTTGGDA